MSRIPYLIATAAVVFVVGGCHGRGDVTGKADTKVDKNSIEERTSPPTIRTQREEPMDQNDAVGVVDVPPNTGGSVIEPTHW